MNGFQIAIIEDQNIYREMLHSMINQWADTYRVDAHIFEFVNGEIFFQMPVNYQVIFIDIELTGSMNGIEIAKRLRWQKYQGDIIFTTSHREYLLEGYDVHAFQYLIKPIDRQRLCRSLEAIYARYSADYYTIFNRGTAIRLQYRNIMYITSSNHNVDIHLRNLEKPYSPKLKFNALIKSFPKNFQQCHRTILVNMDYVSHLCKTELSLIDGTVLPISKTYLQAVQQAVIESFKE